MFGYFLKKFCYGVNLIQFKVGEFLFPLLEPFYQILENRNSETRMHFQQALESFEKKNFNVALVNLDMALSHCPNHFLARVCRARLYARESRYSLAVEDYVVASQTSRFRFIHYDLYREYFSSINREGNDLNSPIIKNFNQAYEILNLDRDRMANFSEEDGLVNNDQHDEDSLEDCGSVFSVDELIFLDEERDKFSKLGPITRKEIEKTDWDVLCKELLL